MSYYLDDVDSLSCRKISVNEYYKNADLIFVGKAVDKEYSKSSFEPPITTFEIEKVYKGNPLNEAEVSTLEMIGDIEFEVGKNYIVFAKPYKGHFLAGGCSPTSLVSESTMKIIDQVILLSEEESNQKFLEKLIITIILISVVSIVTVFVIKRRKISL